MTEVYSTRQLAKLARVTLRQVQWWDEHDILKPREIDGHMRVYAREDVLVAAIIGELRTKGTQLRQVRRIIRDISKLADHYFVTDGDRSAWCATAVEVVTWLQSVNSGTVVNLVNHVAVLEGVRPA